MTPPPELALPAHGCAGCGTELAPDALACPACHVLVHASPLRQLAASAQALEAEGKLVDAREAWEQALSLLPGSSRQHATVAERVSALDARIAAEPGAARPKAEGKRGWRSIAMLLVTAVLLIGGKLKFLLLGLTKASTFVSMLAFLGVYWAAFGWALAAGMVVSIYIHEMGHVAMLRRLGIASGAPLFIPGVGAVVMLKRHITDPATDALIGLAGPVWGLGAGLAAAAAGALTGEPIWFAIAQLTGFLNLFNLLPVWQLDGSRGFHALSTPQRWAVVAALGGGWFLTGSGLLLLVGAVAVWRALQRQAGPGDRRALATFVVLIAALGWLTTLGAAATP